ncbi:retrovirus-related pol polyprotein from transposon TNT 1-94 [Tanacetum coccineum]|uniref:Retrovirus-related pol polyprotein from transposon TNT 1-94 n=1 Tax=Tanacetum coccineum TaxID=301880 RepID=A0ABQ5IBP0_9ASTR
MLVDNSTHGFPICLRVDLELDEWIKDSGCSKHMTGNQKLVLSYKEYNGGNVIFGSNLRGNIIGKGQICVNKCRVTFSEHDSEITKDGKVIGRGIRKKGLYVMKLGNKPKEQICLATIDEKSMLWHRRLGHANMCLIQSLTSKELVRNLPKLKFDKHFYDACKIIKQAHASHKAKNIVLTTRCLKLLHMDLFGPSAVRSYRGNRYSLVIVDDYSRYTWTRFLKEKTKAFNQFKIFSKKIQNQLGCTIVSIRTDHGREFDNEVQFGEFCNANGITHNFLAPRTPQSNGMVERKNRTLPEMSRTMLNEQSLPQKFWCNVVDTSTYILNRIPIRAILGRTPYEFLRGRKPTIDYFRVFGSKCFILNTKDYLTKFDSKSYECVFLGYLQNSKAYIILNKHTRKVEESLNVTFDETPPPSNTSPLVDDDLDEEEAIKLGISQGKALILGQILVPILDANKPDMHVWRDSNGVMKKFSVQAAWEEDIVSFFQPIAHKRTTVSIIGRLLFAASSYFLWIERNNRLFKNVKRSPEDVRDIIMVTVRLKLLSFNFKNRDKVRQLLSTWNMPKKVEESLNVTFDETPPPSKTSPLVDDDLDEEEAIKITEKKNLENDIVDKTLEIDEIVNIKESRMLGKFFKEAISLEGVSPVQPKNVNEALTDDSWIVAMQEELNQFIANDVWELVPQPRNMTIIGTKWVFRNKLDENDIVSRNKARILLAYACALDFKLFQMDVKSAFLNGFINEEVYVAQPPGFIDFEKPDHVYKLKKALYGLKQAPKAWYDRLKAFLIKHEYKMGMVDNTLFTKKKSSNLIIIQIYVYIIFGSTCQDMCDEFAKIMHDEFEMSMMGELNFVLRLQIKQMEDGIFFNQSKYIKEILKKFGLKESKPMKTPMSSDTKLTKYEECESVDSTKYRGMIGSLLYLTASRPNIMFSVCLCARFQEAPKISYLEAVKRIFRYIKGTTHLGLWYPKGTGIETVVYIDSDHVGDYVDRKSTSGICTFVGYCLTSWFSKKQTDLAISTTKAEYVSARKACQQALWMKQALIDYDVRLDNVSIMCDNKGAIDLSKNPVQHSRTKHIEIRHHFLRDNVQKGHISIEKVSSVDNITDILIKPLKRESFNYLRNHASDKQSLDELAYGVPTDGPYQTNPPSPDDIISSIRIDREGQVRRIRHEEEIDVLEYQILTCHKDDVSACLCHMIYYIETSTRYNLAFFILKRMERTRSKPKELLPYGMLLTSLFKLVVSVFPELAIDHYILHDRVMHPLAPHYERKTRSDCGKKRPHELNASSSSTTLNHPSSSHPLDDTLDENDDESFHSNSSSPSQNISSSSNVVSRVRQNPPHESHYLNTHLSETINLQTQQRDAHREGLRSIGQALKNMMGGKRK